MWKKDQAGECRNLLHNVSLQVDINDRWRWNLDLMAGYYVHGVYIFPTSQDSDRFIPLSKYTRHKDVPLKVSLFAWRLFYNS